MVIRLRYGNTNTFFIRGTGGNLLVDTDYESINVGDAAIVRCEDSRKFLEDLGIKGEIIPTTSHSEDSVSLVLDNGVCMVGDLEPMEYVEAYDENIGLKEDWKRVMSYNPGIIYHAHANEKVIK